MIKIIKTYYLLLLAIAFTIPIWHGVIVKDIDKIDPGMVFISFFFIIFANAKLKEESFSMYGVEKAGEEVGNKTYKIILKLTIIFILISLLTAVLFEKSIINI